MCMGFFFIYKMPRFTRALLFVFNQGLLQMGLDQISNSLTFGENPVSDFV